MATSSQREPFILNALFVDEVTHRYGDRLALNQMSLQVQPGEIFGLLGPNGSGKSTLFRLISTLTKVQSGSIEVFGDSVVSQKERVRGKIGVVFQSASLDGKLTVEENLKCQATLYGLSGNQTDSSIQLALDAMGLTDRKKERCEKLSGGLKRRVELAKGMLHHPQLFLMDEPSTGLDPAARMDLWHALSELRNKNGATIVLTTHLLEEAEKCDRIAIMHEGKVVAIGPPESLRRETGEGVLTVTTRQPDKVATFLLQQFQLESITLNNQVRIASGEAAGWVAPIADSMGEFIDSISVGRPSLEDVFVSKTGHKFWDG